MTSIWNFDAATYEPHSKHRDSRKLNRFLETASKDPIMPRAAGFVRVTEPFCEARFLWQILASSLIAGASSQPMHPTLANAALELTQRLSAIQGA
jgi:hypothetical protein